MNDQKFQFFPACNNNDVDSENCQYIQTYFDKNDPNYVGAREVTYTSGKEICQ